MSEWQIAELVENDEVHSSELIGNPTLPSVTGLDLEPVDEVDHVVEPATRAGTDAASSGSGEVTIGTNITGNDAIILKDLPYNQADVFPPLSSGGVWWLDFDGTPDVDLIVDSFSNEPLKIFSGPAGATEITDPPISPGEQVEVAANTTLAVPDALSNSATIEEGARLVLASAASGLINFAADAGTLQLGRSASFTGQISGFGGPDAIDLSDIAFGSQATLGYAANADNSAGALTASDGTHAANLALLGSYMAGSFAAASDGHGGTLITATTNVSDQHPLAPAHS